LETVLTRISNPQAQTGSNETPSFRQTKYCQTERQQILLTTSGYIFPLSKNINLPETRHLIFLSIVLIINISLRQLDTLTGKSMTKFILEIRNQDCFSDISGLYIGSI
jgi:dolichol kinase